MNKIADIIRTSRGNIKVKFNLEEIYNLLKNELGYGFTRIKGKGYYVKKNEEGFFEVRNFINLLDDFRKYIFDNFNILKINGEIEFLDFMNAYYEHLPIKDGNYGKSILRKGFEITDFNEHLILMEIDNKYRREYKVQKMYTFLKDNNFEEKIDKVGSFCTEKPIFYKRLTPESFLIFTRPFVTPKNNDDTFDFYRVMVKKEKFFLKEKIEAYLLENLRLGFDLDVDLEFYNKVIAK